MSTSSEQNRLLPRNRTACDIAAYRRQTPGLELAPNLMSMNVRPTYIFIAAALAAVTPLAAQIPSADDPSLKLTSALAALAQAVPQDAVRIAAERAVPEPRLSVSALPESVQDAVGGGRMRLNDSNEVQVYILMSPVSNERLAQLRAAGVTIEIADSDRRRVQARVPASRLRAIASLPFVDFIRLPAYARRHAGLAITEGDRILHTDAVRNQFGLDGTGVRVGVLSDGLKGIFDTGCTNCGGVANGPIATADLPDAIAVRRAGLLVSSSGGIRGMSFQENGDLEGLPDGACGFAGAGAEGTALLEIVHDLAPGAQLSFANADTDLAFNSAVNFLASTNDVVVDDLGFYGDAYDGTSTVSSNTAAALNTPDFPIRTYLTSVGNARSEERRVGKECRYRR